MYAHSFRNRIVTGSVALPIMTCITAVLWVLPNLGDWRLWTGLLVTGLTTFLLIELSNRNSLLRIRSRMNSTTYLMLMTVCPMLHSWNRLSIPALCFVLSYFMLFSSYQKIRAEGYIFHAFFFAGIGSMFYPPMLVVAVGYYFSMLFQLRNFTWRTFMAGILGALVPYWAYAVYAIWHNQLDTAFLYLPEWFKVHPLDYSQVTTVEWVTGITIFIFALLAFIHFFHTAYNDKIRTRILYYAMATQEVVILCGLVLLPNHFNAQLNLFILNSSLFIAHYYALGKGRFFNSWFNVSLIILVALGIYNYMIIG